MEFNNCFQIGENREERHREDREEGNKREQSILKDIVGNDVMKAISLNSN